MYYNWEDIMQRYSGQLPHSHLQGNNVQLISHLAKYNSSRSKQKIPEDSEPLLVFQESQLSILISS